MKLVFEIAELINKINQLDVSKGYCARVLLTRHEVKVQVYLNHDALINKKLRYFYKEEKLNDVLKVIAELKDILEVAQ